MASADLAAFRVRQVVDYGYVDDDRNTDNAWVETKVCLFHCNNPDEQGVLDHIRAYEDSGVPANAGDVKWHTLGFAATGEVTNLDVIWTSHRDWIRDVGEKLLGSDNFKFMMKDSVGKFVTRAGVLDSLAPEKPVIKSAAGKQAYPNMQLACCAPVVRFSLAVS